MRVGAASLVVLGLIFGCGSGVMDYATQESRPKSGGEFTPFRGAALPLQGKWIGPCVPHPFKSGVYLKELLEFSEGRIHRTQRIAIDRVCVRVLYHQETEGLTATSPSGEYSEAREGVTLLPFGAVGSEMFNQGGVCGVRDWEPSTPQSFDDPAKCGVARLIRGRYELSNQNGKSKLSFESCENKATQSCYSMVYEQPSKSPVR